MDNPNIPKKTHATILDPQRILPKSLGENKSRKTFVEQERTVFPWEAQMGSVQESLSLESSLPRENVGQKGRLLQRIMCLEGWPPHPRPRWRSRAVLHQEKAPSENKKFGEHRGVGNDPSQARLWTEKLLRLRQNERPRRPALTRLCEKEATKAEGLGAREAILVAEKAHYR